MSIRLRPCIYGHTSFYGRIVQLLSAALLAITKVCALARNELYRSYLLSITNSSAITCITGRFPWNSVLYGNHRARVRRLHRTRRCRVCWKWYACRCYCSLLSSRGLRHNWAATLTGTKRAMNFGSGKWLITTVRNKHDSVEAECRVFVKCARSCIRTS